MGLKDITQTEVRLVLIGAMGGVREGAHLQGACSKRGAAISMVLDNPDLQNEFAISSKHCPK
jgi:hypothetical protein